MIRGTEIGRAVGGVFTLAVLTFGAALLVTYCASCTPLDDAQKDQIKQHSAGLALCQALGHVEAKRTGDADAGWSAYYACTVDGGLR